MKDNTVILFLLVSVLFSCNNNENQKNRYKILPENTGNQNEVIVVMEDNLWNGNKGEILRDIFEEEIRGIPWKEKLFNLIQINPKAFSRFFKTHKNIMFASSEVKDSYSKNKWAKDQIVMYLNTDSKEIEFVKSCNKTVGFLDRKELEQIKRNYTKGHHKNARLYVKEQFGFELFLPTEYTVLLKEEEFFMSHFHSYNEKQDLQKWIVVYEFQPTNYDLQEEIIARTDSVLKQYVGGAIEGSYIQIDSRFSLIEDNGIYRGLWNMKKGVIMGGPIIIKSRYIEDKVVVSLGIVFHPNENNRDFVRTFEAIL